MSVVAIFVGLYAAPMVYLIVARACLLSAKRILDTAHAALERGDLDEWQRLFVKSKRRSLVAFPEDWFRR